MFLSLDDGKKNNLPRFLEFETQESNRGFVVVLWLVCSTVFVEESALVCMPGISLKADQRVIIKCSGVSS